MENKEHALEEQPDGTIIPVETTGNKSASVTRLVCHSCGWAGSELKKEGCLTDADEWYVCPGCGLDGSKMRRAD